MRRVVLLLTLAGGLLGLVLVLGRAQATGAPGPVGKPACEDNAVICTEVLDSVGYSGAYTGHDEPAVLFYSNTAGSGNNDRYALTLPKDPPTRPVQSGKGGTYNFQLHPTFWFGMAMCDDQSAPNPGGSSLGATVPCTPNSDSNVYDSSNPSDPHYIGRHPGAAFMEMQFYPPGWATPPFISGVSCSASQWCAAMTIDSLAQNLNTGQQLNDTCASTTGIEYVNFAFITKDGVSQAPANPIQQTLATFTPDPNRDLFMSSGDNLTVSLHDTVNGVQVVINDLTSGQTGSMTASQANGFGEVQYAPPPSTSCTNIPTNFHPMYSTSSEHTRVPWAAHTYNVAFSDEIGHFEYCNGVSPKTGVCNGSSATDPAADADDNFCFSPSQSSRINVAGCTDSDVDFDGVSYQNAWPGTSSNPTQDALVNPTPVVFSSPLFNGTNNYDRAAFETDLPRIEFATNPPCQRHISNPADPSPGSGCVNPPVGASFYPFFSTTSVSGNCRWQLGGAFIPGTTNTFGGSSAAEFGPLLASAYPASNGQPTLRYNNFRQILSNNPCTA
jgi:hypothetical protein